MLARLRQAVGQDQARSSTLLSLVSATARRGTCRTHRTIPPHIMKSYSSWMVWSSIPSMGAPTDSCSHDSVESTAGKTTLAYNIVAVMNSCECDAAQLLVGTHKNTREGRDDGLARVRVEKESRKESRRKMQGQIACGEGSYFSLYEGESPSPTTLYTYFI